MLKIRVFLALYVFIFMCANTAAMAAVASSGFVENKFKTAVSTTGDQSIAGKKTYSESPIIPTPPLP